MDFNEIMTKEINQKIKEQVNKDFQVLRNAFRKFTEKYSCHGFVKEIELIREYAIKSLPEGNGEFIMFPELQDFLFKREAENVMYQILYPQYDPEDTSIIPD